MTDAINPTDVRRAAMDLLSRREHLRSELEIKLHKRFADATFSNETLTASADETLTALVAETLTALAEESLQCDQRYCDSYVHQRSSRGYGPQRIHQELRQKGAGSDHIVLAMDACETDWSELARLTRRKKFGPELPADFKEKSRQLRFLQYRGFGGDYTKEVFSSNY